MSLLVEAFGLGRKHFIIYGVGWFTTVCTVTPVIKENTTSEIYRRDHPCTTGLSSITRAALYSLFWPIILPQSLASLGDHYVKERRKKNIVNVEKS
jgi:hypothetical protein